MFSNLCEGYYKLNVDPYNIRKIAYANKDFINYGNNINKAFQQWKKNADKKLKSLDTKVIIKELINDLAYSMICLFEDITLINKYDLYQVLLSYWNEEMNDDVSLIVSEADGYAIARQVEKITKETKKKNSDKSEIKIVGWDGKLIPKSIIASDIFCDEKKEIDKMMKSLDDINSQIANMIEEADEEAVEKSVLFEISNDGSVKSKDIKEKMDEIMSNVHTPLIDGLTELKKRLPMKKKEYVDYISKNTILEVAYTEKGTVTKASVESALAIAYDEAPAPAAFEDDYDELKKVYLLSNKAEKLTKLIKEMEKELDKKVYDRYESLTDDEIEKLLVEKKWYSAIENGINKLFLNVSNKMSNRIVELSKRYESTYESIEFEIKETEKNLSSMLDMLTGNERDIEGIKQLGTLLGE